MISRAKQLVGPFSPRPPVAKTVTWMVGAGDVDDHDTVGSEKAVGEEAGKPLTTSHFNNFFLGGARAASEIMTFLRGVMVSCIS